MERRTIQSQRSSDPSLEEKNGITELERVNTLGPENTISPALDRAITAKFDRHVIPWLFGLWFLSFLDRSNVGNARIDGLDSDLGLTGNKFNISLAVFYISYILVDVPSNWLIKKVGAGLYLPLLVTGWGICGTCLGFVKSYEGLLVARFFLGMMEGGLLGGIIVHLGMFYRRHELMRRMGFFYCGTPLSGAVGGLLATGLSEIKSGGYNGWPFIFFVEGGITIIFGLVTVFFLPSTPGTSKFLTEEERHAAVYRMTLDSPSPSPDSTVDREAFSWHWVRIALLNWNTLLLSLNFFAIITPVYSFSLFLPTIISGLGYSRIHSNLLTVPPYLLAVLTVILTTYTSDKLKRKGIFMLAGSSLGIFGYIMLISTPNRWIQYGGTLFVAAGIYPCGSLVLGWLANNMAPHYVRATATGWQIAVGNCAAFIATFTYIEDNGPRYIKGHAINIGMLVLCFAATAATMTYCKVENRKRERGERGKRLAGDQSMLGHRHPHFKYAL